MYKYRINEILNNLPMKDYKKAMKLIPKVLGVSTNTFANYRNIKIDEERDIPYQKVILLEKIFELEPETLGNFVTNYKTISELIAEEG